MSEVKERLQQTAMACLESYDAWVGDQKDEDKREALQEAVHELRKVASRLEIDIAVSEREGMRSKPLPIPSHRSANKGAQGDDDGGDAQPRQVQQRKPRRRRQPQGQAAQGQSAQKSDD